VLWGSTAPAIRVGVESLPPFAFVAMRFATAGSLLWVWCRFRGTALPPPREWRDAGIVGTLLLVASNGVFAFALERLPSGVGSLFFALSPLWMAAFGALLYRERLSRLGALGLGIGLAGMIYLVSPSGGQHLPLGSVGLGVAASVAWAFGSMLQRRLRGRDLVQTSAMQMLVAAVVASGVAFATGEHLTRAAFTPPALGALGYLIVFGSLIGFSAFLWLMTNVPTTLASTYSYVNPLVSLAIGVGVLHEAFNARLGIGAAVIVAGVAAMMLAPPPRVAARSGLDDDPLPGFGAADDGRERAAPFELGEQPR